MACRCCESCRASASCREDAPRRSAAAYAPRFEAGRARG
jgi:hypothetical protein